MRTGRSGIVSCIGSSASDPIDTKQKTLHVQPRRIGLGRWKSLETMDLVRSTPTRSCPGIVKWNICFAFASSFHTLVQSVEPTATHYLLIQDKQEGPFTEDEVRAKLASGEATDD